MLAGGSSDGEKEINISERVILLVSKVRETFPEHEKAEKKSSSEKTRCDLPSLLSAIQSVIGELSNDQQKQIFDSAIMGVVNQKDFQIAAYLLITYPRQQSGYSFDILDNLTCSGQLDSVLDEVFKLADIYRSSHATPEMWLFP